MHIAVTVVLTANTPGLSPKVSLLILLADASECIHSYSSTYEFDLNLSFQRNYDKPALFILTNAPKALVLL